MGPEGGENGSAFLLQCQESKFRFLLYPCTTHKIPTKISMNIVYAIESNSSLKTSEHSIGQGLCYCPVLADLSSVHKGRINCIQKKVLRNTDGLSQGSLSLLHMEK